METTKFDYFYNHAEEKYQFIKFPMTLLKDKIFRELSDSAKILYSLLLDRISLSQKNNWHDNDGRTYIIYTIEEMMIDLNKWEKKVTKSLKELTDIGLIETKRQGMGKPNIIYVKDFYSISDTSGISIKPRTSEKHPNKSKNCRMDNSELSNGQLRIVQTTNQEVSNGQGNQTNRNQTNLNQTDLSINPTSAETSATDQEPAADEVTVIDMIDNTNIELIRETISANTDFPELISEQPDKEPQITELYNTVCDVLTAADTDKIRIAKRQLPAATVKQEFLKLGKDHIVYVMDCLNKNGDNIKTNAKSYIRTALYNSIHSIDFYSPKNQTAFTDGKGKATNDNYNIDNFFLRRMKT